MRTNERQQSHFPSGNYRAHAISLRILFSTRNSARLPLGWYSGDNGEYAVARERERERGVRGRKSERASYVRNQEGQRAKETKAYVRGNEKGKPVRDGGSKGRIIVVVLRAILLRLAVNQRAHAVVPFVPSFSQLVSQSANHQPNQPK